MTPDNNDWEYPRNPSDCGAEYKSTQDDKNGDWIAELERELQEFEKKWPRPKNLTE